MQLTVHEVKMTPAEREFRFRMSDPVNPLPYLPLDVCDSAPFCGTSNILRTDRRRCGLGAAVLQCHRGAAPRVLVDHSHLVCRDNKIRAPLDKSQPHTEFA